jgi:Protein of unknown function (DUF2934)
MKPTSRDRTSILRPAGATRAAADSRTASGNVVAGSPSETDRQLRISQIAYFKAQRRDFAPGHDWEDWFAAEREVIRSEGAR